MLSMKEKVFIGVVVILVAVVAASVVLPANILKVKLDINPAGDAIYAPAGNRFTITCNGIADDDKKFSSMIWLDKDRDIILEGVPGVQKVNPNSVQLIFTNPKIEESGVYECQAVYDNKYDLQKTIKIVFQSQEPNFIIDYENITVEVGSQAKLNCSAMGDKPMSYEWHQFEEKVSEDTSSSTYALIYESYSILVVRKVDKSHEGIYTCSARNEHGQKSKIYQLTVIPSSGNETSDDTSIVKVDVRNITSNSVKFDIAVSGTPKSIEVEYRESRMAVENRTVTVWDYGGNYEIKDLLPSGKYTFRFRSVPSEKGNWSPAYTVTLLPDVPELIFQQLEGRSVKVTWFVKTDDIMRGTIDGYELKYFMVQMQRGNSWVPSNCVKTVQIPSCAGSSHTIADLAKGTYYQIQLRAHTASGYGDPYNQKIFLPN